MEHKIAYAASRGTYHFNNGLPCQDAVLGKKWETCAAIALADGAGSCRFSQHGSKSAVETTLDILERNWDFWMNKDHNNVASIIIDGCLKTLDESPYSRDEQASTLLFCVVGPDGTFLCGHIGDGYMFRVSDIGTKVISFPENGESVNETFFLTSPHATDHFRVQKGLLQPGEAILLCSDGAGEALYERETGKCAPAIGKIREWIKEYSGEDVSKALEYNLDTVLRNESPDDMSIALLLYCGEGV